MRVTLIHLNPLKHGDPMNRLKVMTVMGTRPEIIRLSEIIRKLDKYTDHVLVHTNQNYDRELNSIFFEEMELRKPDYLLNVKGSSVGEQIGKILIQTEEVMLKERPDALLILGDTNSALSCIIAKRLKIPIFHMEAGNRCFDDRVPEEINRRIVDHTSDINLTYTEHARRNLLNEGLSSNNIFVTGSPMAEVLEANRDRIERSSILEEMNLKKDGYFLVSAHREENVDDPRNLKIILSALSMIIEKYKYPVVFSTHPRTRRRIEELGITTNESLIFHRPFGMFDYIKLQKNAYCTLSDSGTIHEEASILGFPAAVVRESTERPEAYDTGNVILTGINADLILQSVEMAKKQYQEGVRFTTPIDYRDTNISDKVVRLLIGWTKVTFKKTYYVC